MGDIPQGAANVSSGAKIGGDDAGARKGIRGKG